MLSWPNFLPNSTKVGDQYCLVFGLVDDLDDRHALRPKIRHGPALVLVDARAIGLDRFFRGREERVPVRRSELVPHRLAHQDQRRRVDVTGERHVLLHLFELGGRDHGQRILLAVHGALLQGGEHLGERHRRRDDAELLVGLDVHRILHGSHLEALEVVRTVHRPLAVGHVPEAVFAPCERHDALGGKLAEHLLADRSVEHGARVRVIAHQERNVEDRDFGHEVRHGPRRRHRQVERADLQRLDRFALGAEGAGIEILDLVAAAGSRLDLAGEGVDGDAVVRVLADGDVHLQRGLRERRRGRKGERGGARQREHAKQAVIGA